MNTTAKHLLSLSLALLLAGCGGDDNDTNSEKTLVAFAPGGKLSAEIRWTDYGVPHITADNLQSLAYGSGFAYARDNACILADQMVKIRSERAKYFGPDKIAGSGDSAHLISDFGYLALKVMASANEHYPGLSDNSRALVEGYVAGYNRYLEETGIDNLDPACAGQSWVQPITAQELTAYIFATSQLASGESFMELAFFANPNDDDSYLPYAFNPAATASSQDVEPSHDKLLTGLRQNIRRQAGNFTIPDQEHGDLGSNGWGLGKDKTENGQGILLANPHFPYTGHLRFWQSHVTIPGVLDVMGGSLQGLPGIVNIGFNQNIAWTHTVSNSRRFVLYQLRLSEDNPLQYQYDDDTREISKQSYQIAMKAGDSTITLAKDYYYSHHGLMVETPPEMNLLTWSETGAFTLRDAAEENTDLIDHWLAINLAGNLTEFQQAYRDYDGIPWVNTMYADDAGNAFYIDKTRVLNLSDNALAQMRTDPELVATRAAIGFDILPGNTSVFEPDGLNSYQQAPKLLRPDYVQNSNDSYWATNLNELMSGYSILYGDDLAPLSLRTRMGLTLLSDSSGEDGLFNAGEVETALLSNRSYLAEAVLADLLNQCRAQGNEPVTLNNGLAVNIANACNALGNFSGVMTQDSRSGHIFKEFAFKFDQDRHFNRPFDVNDPLNTPNDLATDGSVLQAFAAAVANINQTSLDYNASLGSIQFTEKTLHSHGEANASGLRFPWAGSTHREGGFNVFSPADGDSTLYPIHQYPGVLDVESGRPLASGLSEQGYHLNYGSSWMFVVSFTDSGPSARGLLAYSQSSDSESPHMDDQNRYYSEHGTLRPLRFARQEVLNNTIDKRELSSDQP
ncbi:penicillin acylase family protein [Thalassomonas viridans]|uniref:Penicillin acylase family protein n=1 Tax=Thalassomonas viridans TaxID=137584 RepID=A0AAE9Z207_9GAMM|nr:penicillin acylase family protein [Thalassomonas viridans]WDE03767.1 penicillin acylase family protein [Thalassomonas viridans]